LSGNNDLNNLVSGKVVAKNTIYNLLGMGLPLILAVVLIPPLIKGFGEERFGILSLVWIVIGYFSFLDLGIGRTLTKIVAEKLGLRKNNEIPSVFWTSMTLIFFISIVGILFFVLFAETLVYDILKISPDLQQETLSTFYLLAFSIPVVTTSAGLRGVLEAYQEFGIINVIRIFLGALTFIIPIVSLIFSDSLFWVVLALIILRFVIWGIYLVYCLRLNNDIRRGFVFNKKDVNPIIKLSGWMTLTNFVSPLIIYSDRFFIGAILSATAITFYSTPYELVSRLLLIPTAVVGVLFPAFSSSYLSNPEFAKKLFRTGMKFVFVIILPVIMIVLTFAYEGIELWLGVKFAENSVVVLQFISIGVLFNSVGFFPFTFLQSIGKANITGLVLLAELPIYLFFLWMGIKYYGINGAAFVWMIRMFVDSAILLFFANRILQFKFNIKYLLFIPVFLGVVIPLEFSNLALKTTSLFIIISLFSFLAWKFFLLQDEKAYLSLSFLRKGK
jgi:O-antigen/teichoic acid export membrane protein